MPVVSVGDYVRVGQKLARGEGSITCEVHATVSGTVLSLDPMPELFGNDLPVIRIENDGKMEADPTRAHGGGSRRVRGGICTRAALSVSAARRSPLTGSLTRRCATTSRPC